MAICSSATPAKADGRLEETGGRGERECRFPQTNPYRPDRRRGDMLSIGRGRLRSRSKTGIDLLLKRLSLSPSLPADSGRSSRPTRLPLPPPPPHGLSESSVCALPAPERKQAESRGGNGRERERAGGERGGGERVCQARSPFVAPSAKLSIYRAQKTLLEGTAALPRSSLAAAAAVGE